MRRIKNGSKYILSIVCVCIIVYSCVCNILKNNSVGILPDEIGYWSPVAMIKGYDWSSSMKVTPYYSFMYGIFLVPIYNLFGENIINTYRSAIIFNTFMLVVCFICIYFFLKKINGDILTQNMYLLCALFITCYPAYLLFAKITLSESLLLCTTWLIIIGFIEYIKYKKTKTLIMLGVLAFIGYYSHQRFLVVIIALVMSIFLFNMLKGELNRKEYGKIFLILGIILILFGAGELFKTAYKEWAYGNNLSGIASTNDYHSMIDKFLAIFNLSKIKNLFISLIGKVFYAGIATYGLIYSGVLFSVEYLYKSCKEKKYENKFYIYFFLLLSFTGSVLLAVIFMNQIPENGQRFDTVIYGRYSEYLYGPIIAISLIAMLKDYKKFIKYETIAFILQIVFMGIMQKIIIESPSYTVQWLSCSAINEFFYNKNYGLSNALLIILLRNGFFLFISLINNCWNKDKVKNIFILVIGTSVFLYSSIYTNNNVHFEYKEIVFQENLGFKEIIEKEEKEKIYCLEDKYITALQFLMPELYIECVQSGECVPMNEILVTPSKYNKKKNLELLREGKYLSLWKVVDSE